MFEEPIRNMDREGEIDFERYDEDYNRHITRHIPPPLPLLPQSIKLPRSDWITRLYPPTYEAPNIVDSIKRIDATNLDEIIQTSEIAITWVKELHQENTALTLDELIILTMYNFDFGNEVQNERSPQNILNHALVTRNTVDLLRLRGFFFSLLVALRKLPLVEPLLQSPTQVDIPLTLFVPVGPDGNMGGFNVNTLFKGFYKSYSKDKPLYKCKLCSKEVFPSPDDLHVRMFDSLFNTSEENSLFGISIDKVHYREDREYRCGMCLKTIQHPTKDDFIIPRHYDSTTNGTTQNREESNTIECFCAECIRNFHRQMQIEQEEDELIGSAFVCPSFVTALSDEKSAKDQLRTQKTFFMPNVPPQYAGTLVKIVARREWCYNIQPYSIFPVPGKVLIEPDRVFKISSVQFDASDVRTVNVEMLDTPLLLEDLAPLRRPGLEERRWSSLQLPSPSQSLGSFQPELDPIYHSGLVPISISSNDYIPSSEDVESETDEDEMDSDEFQLLEINVSGYIYSLVSRTPIYEFPTQPFDKEGITNIDYSVKESVAKETKDTKEEIKNEKGKDKDNGTETKPTNVNSESEIANKPLENVAEENEEDEYENDSIKEKELDLDGYNQKYKDEFVDDRCLLDALRSHSDNTILRNIFVPQNKCDRIFKEGIPTRPMRLEDNRRKLEEKNKITVAKEQLYTKEIAEIEKIISELIEECGSRTIETVNALLTTLLEKAREIRCRATTELDGKKLLLEVFYDKNALKILIDIIKVFPLNSELFCNICKIIQTIPFETDDTLIYNDGVGILLTGLEYFRSSDNICITILSTIKSCFLRNAINNSIKSGFITLVESLFLEYQGKSSRVCTELCKLLIHFSKFSEEAKRAIYTTFERTFFLDFIKSNITEFILVDNILGLLTLISCTFSDFERILIEEGLINTLIDYLKELARAQAKFDPFSPSYFCALIINLSVNEAYRSKLVAGGCAKYIRRFLQDNILSTRHCICACTALEALAVPKKGLPTIPLSVQKAGGIGPMGVDEADVGGDVSIGGIGFLVLMLNARRRDRTICTQICKTLNYFARISNEKAKDIVKCNGLRILVSILEQDTALPLDFPDCEKLCLNACYLIHRILSNFNDFKALKTSDFCRTRKIDNRPSNLLKSYINGRNYDYNYDDYGEDNDDDDVDEDDEIDVEDEDDEDEGEFYDDFEDDNFDYDYDNFDDFALLDTENLTFFVKVLSDVMNVHINNHDIVSMVARILLLISTKFISKELIVDKESVELLTKVVYCYTNDTSICQKAICTIVNYFHYNPMLYNKVDILDMPILLLKTYVLRCDLICEKAMKLIEYLSQNSISKKKILEEENFATILSVAKSRISIEPIGKPFCQIIENLVGSSKVAMECFSEHNIIDIIKIMKERAVTPGYKKTLNETLSTLDKEQYTVSLGINDSNTLALSDQINDSFDDEWTGKKGGLDPINQDAISKALFTLINDLGSEEPERVKTSSGVLLSLVATKGKHVDEPESEFNEDLIGLVIFKYDGVRAGFESIAKNSSTPAICENILKMFGNFANSQCLCDLFIKNGGIDMLVGLIRAGKYDYSTVGHACLTLCAFLGNTVGITVADDPRECIKTVFYGIQQVAVTEFCQKICESISRAISETLNKDGAINKIIEQQIPFIVSLIRKRIDSQAICLALCKIIYSFLEHFTKKQGREETAETQTEGKGPVNLFSLIDRNEVVRLLSQVTEIHYKSPEFCKVICKIVSILINEGGKGEDKDSENTFRSELIKRGFISKLINIMLTYSSNNEVIVSSAYLLSTILHTAGGTGNNKEVRQNLTTILSIFKFNMGNPGTCAAFLTLLSKIDPTLLLQNDGEGIRLIITAITTYKTQTSVFETALSILRQATTAARQRGAGPCGSTFMFTVGDVSVVVNIALNFISSRDICFNALYLLYNILTPQPPSTSSLLLADDNEGTRDGVRICGRKRSVELVGRSGTIEFAEEVAKRYSHDAEIGIWLGVVVTALSESEQNSATLEKKDIYHHLAEFLKQNPTNETLVKNIFGAISRLCTPASFCPQATVGTRAKKTLADLVDLSLGALQRLRFQEVITVFCCCVLATLSYNTDCCARRIAQPANVPIVVKALECNMGSLDTCNNVCIVLCNALCGTDEATVRAAKIVADSGGVKLLLEVLRKHASAQIVVKNAASALKNLSNAPGMVEKIREADGVNIIGSVLRSIPQEDEQTRQYVELIYKTVKETKK